MTTAAQHFLVMAAGCSLAGCGHADSPTAPVTLLDVFAPPSVAVGGTLGIGVRVYPQVPVSLISETPTVATVSALGVTGVAPGTATLRATAGQTSASATVTVFPTFSDLIVGARHLCARTASGALYCWGNHFSGMLGPIAAPQVCPLEGIGWECSTTPVASVSSPTFVQVSAGISDTCGRTAAGEAYCWGGNPGHLLSPASEVCSDGELCTRTPVKVQGAPSFAWIGAGDTHFCGLTATGTAYCWGTDEFGQLGAPASENCGTAPCSRVPVAVSGGLTFQTLGMGAYHTCGLTAAGAASCWGWNYHGQLGIGRTSEFLGGEPAPVAVATALAFATISASRDHTCALTPGGQAYCWGRDSTGQLGDGSTSDALIPRPVAGGLSFDSITTGLMHTCALTHAGVAYCWGHNGNQARVGGQLGDGTFVTRLTPTLLARPLTFVQLRAGWNYTCGRTAPGTVYCWGSNAHGQIGVGALTTWSFPTPTGVGGIP